MDTLKQVLEILSDLGIVIGVPTLIALWLHLTKARIKTLQERIKFLQETQYSNALAEIQAQRALYEIRLRELSERLRTQEMAARDRGQRAEIQRDIQAVQQSIDSLSRWREDIVDGIEAEAIRKFEQFCKKLPDPDKATAEHIFISTTYGDGISPVLLRALERKGVIVIREENVYLTDKGKEIWKALRNSQKLRD